MATWDAPLLAVGAAAEPEAEEDPAAAVDPAAAEVPLASAESAPGVGAPKVLTPDGMGPGGAEAEAPIPTKNPAPCCRKRKE